LTAEGGGNNYYRGVFMELLVSVLGLVVGIIGGYFSYESYKKSKDTDC